MKKKQESQIQKKSAKSGQKEKHKGKGKGGLSFFLSQKSLSIKTQNDRMKILKWKKKKWAIR